jgi:hypothetical protein
MNHTPCIFSLEPLESRLHLSAAPLAVSAAHQAHLNHLAHVRHVQHVKHVKHVKHLNAIKAQNAAFVSASLVASMNNASAAEFTTPPPTNSPLTGVVTPPASTDILGTGSSAPSTGLTLLG